MWRPDSKLQSCRCFTNWVQMQCVLVPSAHSGQVASKVVDSVGEDQYCSGISSISVDFEAKFQAMGSGSISDKCENGSQSQIKYVQQRRDSTCSDLCCATQIQSLDRPQQHCSPFCRAQQLSVRAQSCMLCENGGPFQIKYVRQRRDSTCSDFCCATQIQALDRPQKQCG